MSGIQPTFSLSYSSPDPQTLRRPENQTKEKSMARGPSGDSSRQAESDVTRRRPSGGAEPVRRTDSQRGANTRFVRPCYRHLSYQYRTAMQFWKNHRFRNGK